MQISTDKLIAELDNQLIEGIITQEQYIKALLIIHDYK